MEPVLSASCEEGCEVAARAKSSFACVDRAALGDGWRLVVSASAPSSARLAALTATPAA